MRWLFLCLALILAPVSAARAAIGAPTYIGSNADATNTATSLVITTGANAPAGCMIGVEIIGSSAINTSFAITDSASNAYTTTTFLNWNGSNRQAFAYSPNPVLLSSGGTITLSWTGGGRIAASAVSVCGLGTAAPLDITGAGTTGTGTSDSIATGTLTQADEIIFAATGLANTSAGYTPGGSFTTLTAPTQGTNSTLLWSYQIVAATTTVTYGPTWTTSRGFGSNVWTFKQGGGVSGPPSGSRALLGVGR